MDTPLTQTPTVPTTSPDTAPDNPHWYKDAVIYQIHVRSFFDANNDGYGDFEGLRQKLPYLEELGVNTLWLLPFYDSPLKDDGYDIADYYNILPVHGDLDEFKAFLDEAHARGMRVITELVLNHTSDQHPWFQEARRPGSAKRDWYVWSDTSEKYADVRIIFTDTEHSNWSWDPIAGAYYWHRFFSHQPDLNWDNPDVERAMHEVMFYWLDMGVDGLRLDAVPYLYEREGTSGENLPETLDAIKRLRKVMDERYSGSKVLLAEANQWPEDTLPYFGTGDGVQMAFNFPLMPRMYLALRRENRQPIAEMLNLTDSIPEEAQWALFLRNHDELTLEMVTDEERDFMYNEYAMDRKFRLNLGIRRRLAPLLGGERRRIELMNALVLSLKGSPIIYYGDEIGMGDNTFLGDRNGVRTPMQWSPDRNAGFSRAPFHQLFLPPINEGSYSYRFINVEEAQGSVHSLYHFMRRIIRLRNQHGKTFGRGSLEILPVANERVLAFTRDFEGETLLVVANLSRFAQAAYLPLHKYVDRTPIELFSQAPFPPIPPVGEGSEGDYPITLSPHGFYWFLLKEASEEPALEEDEEVLDRKLPTFRLSGGLETMLVDTMVQGEARGRLERALPEYLKVQRWFGSKERPIKLTKLVDAVRLQAEPPAYLALVRVEFEDGGLERYFLPLTVKAGEEARALLESHGRAALAWLEGPTGRRLLHDATVDDAFWLALYRATQRNWKGRSLQGLYSAATFPGAGLPDVSTATALSVEQSNSSAAFEGKVFAKLYRKLEEESNPEVEMLGYLTRAGFPFVPQIQGELRFRRGDLSLTLGILQSYILGGGDAWAYALEENVRYLGRTAETPPPAEALPTSFVDPAPAWLEDAAGESLQLASLLGVRTAEMHAALSRADAPALRPEPTTQGDLVGMSERLRREADETLALLQERGAVDRTALEAGLSRLDVLAQAEADWLKIRVHGDYHLGQVIRADGELYLLDFEGEPARPLSERRLRDQAVRDVAGMLRSLEYAGLVAWQEYVGAQGGQNGLSETWADILIRWSEAVFLEAYFATAGEGAPFIPQDTAVRDLLIWAYQLDKVLYEVRYELGSRPDWVWLPLRGLERLLKGTPER